MFFQVTYVLLYQLAFTDCCKKCKYFFACQETSGKNTGGNLRTARISVITCCDNIVQNISRPYIYQPFLKVIIGIKLPQIYLHYIRILHEVSQAQNTADKHKRGSLRNSTTGTRIPLFRFTQQFPFPLEYNFHTSRRLRVKILYFELDIFDFDFNVFNCDWIFTTSISMYSTSNYISILSTLVTIFSTSSEIFLTSIKIYVRNGTP